MSGAMPACSQPNSLPLRPKQVAISSRINTGKLRIGELQVRGLRLAEVVAEARAANGRVDVAPHSAKLYQGAVTGALSLDADGNRVALKEALTDVAIGPLLKDVAQKAYVEGRGSISLDVAAAGASVEAMKRALGGTAKAPKTSSRRALLPKP